MKTIQRTLRTFILLLALSPIPAAAEFIAILQGGAVYSSRNDVALPGDTGTRFSYVDDLDSDIVFSPRVEAGYEFAGRHYVGLMASWLRIRPGGRLDRAVEFDGKTFPAGSDVKGRFRFDSYRASYRYYFLSNGIVKLGAGITGKIRDAGISLEGGGQKGGLDNTGFVPLLNFYLEWIVSPALSLLACGDAAWSPYGRAEDVFAGSCTGTPNAWRSWPATGCSRAAPTTTRSIPSPCSITRCSARNCAIKARTSDPGARRYVRPRRARYQAAPLIP